MRGNEISALYAKSMPLIRFTEMSKTNIKVAPYWIKVDILKHFAEN